MTPQEINAELRACLALQEELYAGTDELTQRFKTVLLAWEELKKTQPLLAEIDGEFYQLKRYDFEDTQDTIQSARKHGGFYSMYRLIKIGKPI
jgi:hypothetical protein